MDILTLNGANPGQRDRLPLKFHSCNIAWPMKIKPKQVTRDDLIMKVSITATHHASLLSHLFKKPLSAVPLKMNRVVK